MTLCRFGAIAFKEKHILTPFKRYQNTCLYLGKEYDCLVSLAGDMGIFL